MKEIKKYTSIIRYGKSTTVDVLNEGDIISITEKIDGANASFRIDETNELGVSCYSRNCALDRDNTLGGFYNWVGEYIVPLKDKLNPNYIYYGEWLNKHKVVYKEEYYKKFYLFSIWDIKNEKYLGDEIVISEAERLGLTTVNYFYIGKFISYNHLMSFVGKSTMTLEPNTGEGIVVKNVSYRDKYGSQCFVKIVSEKFAEVQQQKKPKNPNIDKVSSLVHSVLTKPRVEKLLFKLIDEGKLKEGFSTKDIGTVLKLLGNAVYEDIMKEESDMFLEFEEELVRKTVGKNTPKIVKEIIKEREKSTIRKED